MLFILQHLKFKNTVQSEANLCIQTVRLIDYMLLFSELSISSATGAPILNG